MNVLLDTVALYRAVTQPETLPANVRQLLQDRAHTLHVSLISAWELAIKASLGKLTLPCPLGDFFTQATRDLLATTLGLELDAIVRVTQLPPHHRDPFDRLLIAQALTGNYAVATSDARFSAYGLKVIW
jgi:PIN domain nuclease of toxin-antitoxin system